MVDDRSVSGAQAGPAFPRVLLGVAWALAALGVGLLGWLLVALSDRGDDRLGGLMLLGVALLGGVTAAVLLIGHTARRLSLSASAVFLLGGAAAAVVMLVDGPFFVGDLLLIGGVPAVCGLLTGLLALRGRS